MAYEWIIDALDQTWTSLDHLMRVQPASAYDALTACPGWSVRDVISHLLGFEQVLRGEPVPQYHGEWPDYVRNPIGEFNETVVAAHRAEPGLVVLDQFRATAQRSLARLRDLSDEEWVRVGWSPEGERPYHRFMETRVLDSWIHLQDIRDALLQPEDDHGPGEEIVLNRFEASLPFIIGKRLTPPEGTIIQLNLTGRLARTVIIQMVDGRATARTQLTHPPDLEISTPVALFWRRAAGRISDEAFLSASATDVRGNQTLARGLAASMVVMI